MNADQKEVFVLICVHLRLTLSFEVSNAGIDDEHLAAVGGFAGYRLTVRPATLDDIPFIDALQKLHTKQVGWMPTATFEGKIRAGHVLIAEESGQWAGGSRQENTAEDASSSSLPPATCPPPTPVGYLIGNDQYFKRDDVGIVYQLNVLRMFAAAPVPAEVEKPKREPKPPRVKPKNDPRLVAAARELRDRWLDEVNGGRAESPVRVGREKYAVGRSLGERMAIDATPLKRLAA